MTTCSNGLASAGAGVAPSLELGLDRQHLVEPVDHDGHAVLTQPPDDLVDPIGELAGVGPIALALVAQLGHVVLHRIGRRSSAPCTASRRCPSAMPRDA